MKLTDSAFKKLKAEWYRKLEKSGFEDAENRLGLKKYHSFGWLVMPERDVKRELATEYFRRAAQFAHSHKFDSETEKRIWQLHSEGTTFRDIIKLLRKEHIRVGNVVLGRVIKKIRELMQSSKNEDFEL